MFNPSDHALEKSFREKDPDLGPCELCGLPLHYAKPSIWKRPGKNYRFCCTGCKQVFRMLADISGSENPDQFRNTDLFRQCQNRGIIPRSEQDLVAQSLLFPEGANSVHQNLPKTPEQGQKPDDHLLHLQLSVEGMWCPACAWVIEKYLQKNEGIHEVSCFFSNDRLKCGYDPVKTTPEKIVEAIEKLGYSARKPGEDIQSGERKKEFIRLVFSAFLTVNIMMLSFSLYSGFFTDLPKESIFYISFPIFLMATVVLFYGGAGIHKKGWTAWKNFGFGMESLISAGSLTAYGYSVVNLFFGSIHLYFDTASMLIALVLLGKMIENRAKDKVTGHLESFFSLAPTKVRICTPEIPKGRYVQTSQLQKEDLFFLEEDEISPADGLVVEGSGIVDESSVTGEPAPRTKKAGDRIKSGTRIKDGFLKIRAEAVGKDALLGQMILLMEKALDRKTPIEGKTDVALKWFVPVIFILAVGTGLIGWLFGLSTEDAIVRAVTVMVISCPCALGIAIPLARVAGISLAARKGILVRDFAAFEQAGNIDAFVFDKTGTLTRGDWELLKVECAPGFEKDTVLSIASALESGSEHPVAIQIKRFAEKKKIKPASMNDKIFHENGVSAIFPRTGSIRGIEAKIGAAGFVFPGISSGQRWKNKMNSSLLFPMPFLSNFVESSGALGLSNDTEQNSSHVYLSLNGILAAVFFFGDRIKPGSKGTVENLHSLGIPVSMVSGDGRETTGKIAEKLTIANVFGEMMPADKAQYIEKLKREGKRVAAAGDGINDAPALAAAHLSFAVHSGSHLGKEAADVTLMRGEPSQIIEFFHLTRKVNRKITGNLVFTFLYNFTALPIAMGGILSPLVAVCAMLLSSLTVTGNILLLTRN